jgi:hypothetical protein
VASDPRPDLLDARAGGRVEEIGRTDLDNHERFPATSSHAFKHGYLDRPVVDEWLHLLGQVIQRQWPGVPEFDSLIH